MMVGKFLTGSDHPKRTLEVQLSVWRTWQMKVWARPRLISGRRRFIRWGLSWLFSGPRFPGADDCDRGYPSTGHRILWTYLRLRASSDLDPGPVICSEPRPGNQQRPWLMGWAHLEGMKDGGRVGHMLLWTGRGGDVRSKARVVKAGPRKMN